MPGEEQIVRLLGWGCLAVIAYLTFQVVGPFLAPLGWAAVFAILVHPVYRRLEPRWGSGAAALAGTIVVAVAVVAPAVAVTGVIATEAIDASSQLQRALADGRVSALARSAAVWVERMAGDGYVDISAAAADMVRQGAEVFVARSGLALRDAVLFGVNVGIALFATFFVLRDSRAILATVRRLLPMPESMREALIARVSELVAVGVAAAAIVAAVQGTLGGLTFWALGLPAPAFWGVVMGLLCLFPFGAWVVWLPAAIALAVNGEVGRGLVLAVIGVAVVSGIDNVLRPALVSTRAHMHGLVILVGLLGGAAAFGALGLVIGPVVLASALALLNAYLDAASTTSTQSAG